MLIRTIIFYLVIDVLFLVVQQSHVIANIGEGTHFIVITTYSLHDRVVKKGVSFLRGNVSIITSSDLSDMHVISMNVILPPRRREG